MKKMILCAGALLFVGTAFAQSGTNPWNESHVIVFGGGNTGTVSQTSSGGMLFNYSQVFQVGMNNADIVQVGANDSYVVQTGGNLAAVNQTGGTLGYQISHLDQMGVNIADIDQSGNTNNSDVDQVSGMMILANEANVQQGQVDATSVTNMSVIDQANDGNFTRHIQDGVSNVANSDQDSFGTAVPVVMGYLQGSHITQSGDRNWANVDQDGDNQLSRVTQTAAIGGTVAGMTNEALITQSGEMNESVAFQNDMMTMMSGADNVLLVTQTNGVGGAGNSSLVTQNGVNAHTITQNN